MHLVWLWYGWLFHGRERCYTRCKPSTKSYIMVVQFSCQAAMQCSTLQAMNIIIYRRWNGSSCWKVSTSNDKKGKTQPSHFPALLNQKNMRTANLKFQVSFLIWGTSYLSKHPGQESHQPPVFSPSNSSSWAIRWAIDPAKKTIICRLSKVVQP